MENTIKRINELAAIAKTRELTEAEAAERGALRRRYIDAFKNNLRSQLDNIYFAEKDGTVTKPEKKSDK